MNDANTYQATAGLQANAIAGEGANDKQVYEAALKSKTYIQLALVAAGLYKQYDALEKQGNLAEAQIGFAERNIKLAERNFDETIMPSYKLANDYFYNYYRKSLEPKLEAIVACGMKQCEYTPQYDKWIPRGLADVSKVINGIKRTSRRSSDIYSVGACFEVDFKTAEMQANMTRDTINFGRIHEDDIKLKKDQFYWNRFTTAAQVALNVGALSAAMQKDSKSALLTSLQLQSQSIGVLDGAVGSAMGALSQAGNFYGSLGGLVGSSRGTDYGRDVGQAILGQGYNPLGKGNSPISYTPEPIKAATVNIEFSPRITGGMYTSPSSSARFEKDGNPDEKRVESDGFTGKPWE